MNKILGDWKETTRGYSLETPFGNAEILNYEKNPTGSLKIVSVRDSKGEELYHRCRISPVDKIKEFAEGILLN